jgi:hypothetical protein
MLISRFPEAGISRIGVRLREAGGGDDEVGDEVLITDPAVELLLPEAQFARRHVAAQVALAG